MQRIAIRVVLLLLVQTCCTGTLDAESFRVSAKPSRNRRLAPELDLLRECKGNLVGFCRRGKPIIEVPSDQAPRMQSMALSSEAEAPQAKRRPVRLLVSYDKQAGRPTDATLKTAGLRTVEDYKSGSFLVVEPVASVSAQTVETLLNDETVVHAAPDYIMSIPSKEEVATIQEAENSATPTDPLYGKLWGMKNINANKVWQVYREAPSVIVAVIDTGVDYTHPDLQAHMWTKNGRHGFDFFDDDEEPMDEQNHGTHCAGTIAAVGNNNVGVVGVCWKTQIMAMRFLGPDGSGVTSDAVKCIDWAVANGAHVLSNSWAGPDSSVELQAAIARAEQKGVLFVAAAGNTVGNGNNNDTYPYYPAALPNPNIIAVGAIDVNDARGSFSHYGKKSVDIGAPGVAIVSTVLNSQYAQFDGTSMAAPHVAGAAALIWSKTFATPTQSPTQMATVRDLIYQNARPIPALANFWGYNAPARVPGGVLDLSFLLGSSPGQPPTTPTNPVVRRFIERRSVVDPIKLR